MGRKRKVIKGDFIGQSRVDIVALDTKPYFVPQEDGQPHPAAEIISSRVWQRQPKPLDAVIPRFKPMMYANQPGKKWCAGECGDWKMKSEFSPKADARDKLHPYCKACRARHAKRLYWAAKEAAQLRAVA